MIKFAITGNIACGKSTVENILKMKGYKVLDTDIVGHNMLQNNKSVGLAFKDCDIFDGENISREKLGKIVFNNPEKLKKLNSILHPQIKKEIEKFFDLNKSENKVFVSIPLLFEAKMQDLFDKIIFIYAEDSIRLKRLINRNGYEKDYALKRLASQLPQEEKMKKCDIIINNNGTIEDLAQQIELSNI